MTVKPAQDNLPREKNNLNCHYCQRPIKDQGSSFSAYWSPNIVWRVHPECKDLAQQEDRITCQTIDANCNDCKFFNRGARLAKGVDSGTCSLFNKEVKAVPNTWQGNPCFIHRKI